MSFGGHSASAGSWQLPLTSRSYAIGTRAKTLQFQSTPVNVDHSLRTGWTENLICTTGGAADSVVVHWSTGRGLASRRVERPPVDESVVRPCADPAGSQAVFCKKRRKAGARAVDSSEDSSGENAVLQTGSLFGVLPQHLGGLDEYETQRRQNREWMATEDEEGMLPRTKSKRKKCGDPYKTGRHVRRGAATTKPLWCRSDLLQQVRTVSVQNQEVVVARADKGVAGFFSRYCPELTSHAAGSFTTELPQSSGPRSLAGSYCVCRDGLVDIEKLFLRPPAPARVEYAQNGAADCLAGPRSAGNHIPVGVEMWGSMPNVLRRTAEQNVVLQRPRNWHSDGYGRGCGFGDGGLKGLLVTGAGPTGGLHFLDPRVGLFGKFFPSERAIDHVDLDTKSKRYRTSGLRFDSVHQISSSLYAAIGGTSGTSSRAYILDARHHSRPVFETNLGTPAWKNLRGTRRFGRPPRDEVWWGMESACLDYELESSATATATVVACLRQEGSCMLLFDSKRGAVLSQVELGWDGLCGFSFESGAGARRGYNERRVEGLALTNGGNVVSLELEVFRPHETKVSGGPAERGCSEGVAFLDERGETREGRVLSSRGPISEEPGKNQQGAGEDSPPKPPPSQPPEEGASSSEEHDNYVVGDEEDDLLADTPPVQPKKVKRPRPSSGSAGRGPGGPGAGDGATGGSTNDAPAARTQSAASSPATGTGSSFHDEISRPTPISASAPQLLSAVNARAMDGSVIKLHHMRPPPSSADTRTVSARLQKMPRKWLQKQSAWLTIRLDALVLEQEGEDCVEGGEGAASESSVHVESSKDKDRAASESSVQGKDCGSAAARGRGGFSSRAVRPDSRLLVNRYTMTAAALRLLWDRRKKAWRETRDQSWKADLLYRKQKHRVVDDEDDAGADLVEDADKPGQKKSKKETLLPADDDPMGEEVALPSPLPTTTSTDFILELEDFAKTCHDSCLKRSIRGTPLADLIQLTPKNYSSIQDLVFLRLAAQRCDRVARLHDRGKKRKRKYCIGKKIFPDTQKIPRCESKVTTCWEPLIPTATGLNVKFGFHARLNRHKAEELCFALLDKNTGTKAGSTSGLERSTSSDRGHVWCSVCENYVANYAHTLERHRVRCVGRATSGGGTGTGTDTPSGVDNTSKRRAVDNMIRMDIPLARQSGEEEDGGRALTRGEKAKAEQNQQQMVEDEEQTKPDDPQTEAVGGGEEPGGGGVGGGAGGGEDSHSSASSDSEDSSSSSSSSSSEGSSSPSPKRRRRQEVVKAGVVDAAGAASSNADAVDAAGAASSNAAVVDAAGAASNSAAVPGRAAALGGAAAPSSAATSSSAAASSSVAASSSAPAPGRASPSPNLPPAPSRKLSSSNSSSSSSSSDSSSSGQRRPSPSAASRPPVAAAAQPVTAQTNAASAPSASAKASAKASGKAASAAPAKAKAKAPPKRGPAGRFGRRRK